VRSLSVDSVQLAIVLRFGAVLDRFDWFRWLGSLVGSFKIFKNSEQIDFQSFTSSKADRWTSSTFIRQTGVRNFLKHFKLLRFQMNENAIQIDQARVRTLAGRGELMRANWKWSVGITRAKNLKIHTARNVGGWTFWRTVFELKRDLVLEWKIIFKQKSGAQNDFAASLMPTIFKVIYWDEFMRIHGIRRSWLKADSNWKNLC